ncbi:MAG: uroporphyrinogen decarboxylase [Chlamydiia bacterium]|nr:uroporphyrinogen decarboxylase [Chlamydiia bacterium]
MTAIVTVVNSLFQKALRCQNTDRPPIWLMRQAGRYLPPYQKLRSERSLLEMFHCKQTIVEVTKQPINILGVDAAIVFSDILMVLDGFGIDWRFEEGLGPVITPSIEKVIDLPEKIQGYPYSPLYEAILQLKSELRVPLLGFAGAPFTIASYLIEGKTSRDHLKTKKWLYSDPLSFHSLLNKITEAIIDFLLIQREAGVDAVQLFDSWAGILSADLYEEFSCSYLKKIIKALNIPVILYSRGSSYFASRLVKIRPNCISVDWSLPLKEVRKQIPAAIAVQGNLDPSLLFSSQRIIEREVLKLLKQMNGDPGFIFNLGHGVLSQTPVENVLYLVDLVKSWRPSLLPC